MILASQEYVSRSEEETLALAANFAKTLKQAAVIAFYGDLAAGKTTFIKGIVQAFSQGQDLVFSPTFVYLNHYPVEPAIFHFDLYRLKDAKAFIKMGFEDYLFEDAIICLEWAERIEDILPKDLIRVEMKHLGDEGRLVRITQVS